VLEADRATLYALPGVPAELQAMFLASVAPRLAGIGTGRARRSLRVFGPTESVLDERLSGLPELAGLERTLLAAPEGIEIHLTAIGPNGAEAERCAGRAERQIRAELGTDVVGPSDETVATAVGRALAARGLRLASAESCTAGLLGAVLTAAPGASAWYRGGWIVYADDLKLTLCGIDPRLLEEHGAVSSEVALALAQAARERLSADVALAITGIAGPGGGSAEKPVGTVHIALCDGAGQLASRHHFGGDRESVRRRAVHTALDRLRRRLLERA
jgi:nicotinamide-nucleotide amidase